jgi:hypothetical protein
MPQRGGLTLIAPAADVQTAAGERLWRELYRAIQDGGDSVGGFEQAHRAMLDLKRYNHPLGAGFAVHFGG